MHHLEIDGKQYLLDCGIFQGHRKEADEKNRKLPFPAESIDAVILSHAHIDHTGNLPTLVKKWIPRSDLRNSGDRRFMRAHVARYGIHSGAGRRVPK